jgi:hypothetical protein
LQADLLVCDMNDHPIRVGEHLLPLLPKLKPGELQQWYSKVV